MRLLTKGEVMADANPPVEGYRHAPKDVRRHLLKTPVEEGLKQSIVVCMIRTEDSMSGSVGESQSLAIVVSVICALQSGHRPLRRLDAELAARLPCAGHRSPSLAGGAAPRYVHDQNRR
jgi:hypothetical protein